MPDHNTFGLFQARDAVIYDHIHPTPLLVKSTNEQADILEPKRDRETETEIERERQILTEK
jgi:hypothetical protein